MIILNQFIYYLNKYNHLVNCARMYGVNITLPILQLSGELYMPTKDVMSISRKNSTAHDNNNQTETLNIHTIRDIHDGITRCVRPRL